MAVVRDYYEKGLSLLQLSALHDVGRHAPGQWVSKYGARVRESLPYGSAARKEAGIMKKEKLEKLPPGLDFLEDGTLSMEEKLRLVKERYTYVCAENRYLKKLAALVQERIARESGKGRKPSRD